MGECKVEFLGCVGGDHGVIVNNIEQNENCGKQTPLQEAGRKPVFCLYITGAALKSTQAITNLKPVLDGLFKDGYDLRVIDVYQNPPPPGSVRVCSSPMLVREYPLPVLRIGGDFSSPENVWRMLSIRNPQENLGE